MFRYLLPVCQSSSISIRSAPASLSSDGSFAAAAFLQGRREKFQVPSDLGHIDGDLAHPGIQCLGFIAVGVAPAGLCSLIGAGIQGVCSLDLHGLVQ